MAGHNVKVSGPPFGDDQGDAFFSDRLVLWDELIRDEVLAFKAALDAARDEGDMQRLLEAHPRLLVRHLTTGRRSWVIPKKRLGSEHETDFVIAQKASDGYIWYAVELERPQAKMFTKNGDPSAALTHALRQIDDWRDWLSHNRDYAQRPRERSGLGLIDINSELEGMVIIGRDADFDRRATASLRQRLERSHRVKIETYDWLLAQAGERLAALEERAKNYLAQNPVAQLVEAWANKPRMVPEAQRVLTEVFGGITTGWTAPSRVRDEIEWEGVEIWPDPSGLEENLAVPFKVVYSTRRFEDNLLQTSDWDDWFDYIIDTLQSAYSLLITEIAPDESLQESLTLAGEAVWYRTYEWHDDVPVVDNLHVLVHLPRDASYDEKRGRVAKAREVFRDWIPDEALDREREAEHVRAVERWISSLSLAPGQRVTHTKFGVGTVVSISGEGAQVEAVIDFGAEYGIKHLMLRHAPLEKL